MNVSDKAKYRFKVWNDRRFKMCMFKALEEDDEQLKSEVTETLRFIFEEDENVREINHRLNEYLSNSY